MSLNPRPPRLGRSTHVVENLEVVRNLSSIQPLKRSKSPRWRSSPRLLRSLQRTRREVVEEPGACCGA